MESCVNVDREMTFQDTVDYVRYIFEYNLPIYARTSKEKEFRVEINDTETFAYFPKKIELEEVFKLTTYLLIREQLDILLHERSELEAFKILEPIVDAFQKQHYGIIYDGTKRKKH